MFRLWLTLDFKPHPLHCRLLHMFPGSLTLGEVTSAVWGVRGEWFELGRVLDLSYRTLTVIEGHAVSSMVS